MLAILTDRTYIDYVITPVGERMFARWNPGEILYIALYTTPHNMNRHILLTVLLLGMFSFLTAQVDSLDAEMLADEDVGISESDWLEFQTQIRKDQARKSEESIKRETRQAKLLKQKIQADLGVIEEEVSMLNERITALEREDEELGRKLAKLTRTNEDLLSENNELAEASELIEEEDEETVNENLVQIRKNDQLIGQYEQRILSNQQAIAEAEERIEDTQESMARLKDQLETCKGVISSNQQLLGLPEEEDMEEEDDDEMDDQ